MTLEEKFAEPLAVGFTSLITTQCLLLGTETAALFPNYGIGLSLIASVAGFAYSYIKVRTAYSKEKC